MPDTPFAVDAAAQALARPLTDQTTVIAGYARAIGRALEHHGIDAQPIFAAVGLVEPVSNDPLQRMTTAMTTALYQASVAATQDPYFGLTVGRHIQASNIHAFGHAMLASRNLLDVCLRFERHFALASQSAVARVERSDTEIALRFRHVVPVCGESEDACLSFVHGLMRTLHHADFAPSRVEFRHACPAPGAGPYEACFGVRPMFGQRETALVWPAADMLRTLPGDCPELAQANDKLAGDYIARLDKSDVVARVRARVTALIASDDCTRGRVAQDLHMSEAKLHLKLRLRGTTFDALYDATRKELALSYLSRRALSLTEIAFMLGYTDSSNFNRAFKRWTGLAPSAHRAAASGGDQPPHDLAPGRAETSP